MDCGRSDRDLPLVPAFTTMVAGPGADESDDGVDQDDVLIDRLMRWDTAYLGGEDLAPESICPDEPALAAMVRAQIARRKKLYGLIGLGEAPGYQGPDAGRFPEIPGHEVLRELGRGGMGVVYLARDQRLGRVVAIKTIAEARLATPGQLNRFFLKARAVARLRHPNIIAIHAIGEDPGQPYLSLEFVDGASLAERLADRPIAPLDAALLLESLARAVQAVHEQGIVHRDLKPSNVLLTAQGVPKIADFGLAKLKDGEAGRTLAEQVLGTPSFMAPEQADGHSRDAGPAADVYALGAILYQALTGRPPFLGESAMETLRLVTSTDPVPPRRQRPGVPRDLETICLYCLEKEPARRYPTAAALADDLHRFRVGLSIAARPVGPAGRTWRWGRRNKMLALTAAALTLTFVLGTPALFGLWLRARADHVLAMAERNRAVSSGTMPNGPAIARSGPCTSCSRRNPMKCRARRCARTASD